MTKRYVITREDGGVSILAPTKECTPELLLRDIMAVEGYVSHVEIDEGDMLEDRTFRNAWCVKGGKLDHDVAKACKLIRDKRNKKLEILDMKAFTAERKKDAAEIAAVDAEAQRLRDIPQTKEFESTKIEDLKKCMEAVEIQLDMPEDKKVVLTKKEKKVVDKPTPEAFAKFNEERVKKAKRKSKKVEIEDDKLSG